LEGMSDKKLLKKASNSCVPFLLTASTEHPGVNIISFRRVSSHLAYTSSMLIQRKGIPSRALVETHYGSRLQDVTHQAHMWMLGSVNKRDDN
jgi:hypothetical protein